MQSGKQIDSKKKKWHK